MPSRPVPADPGWDDDPAWSRPDPMAAQEREAWLDHLAAQDDPFDPEEWLDPADELTAQERAEIRAAAGQAGRAAAFGSGMALDVMPGAPELALFADAAAGDDDSYEGASDAELAGVLCAWDRLEAHAAGRKLAAVAELIRRNPEPGCDPEGPGGMPSGWDEFTADELADALAESRGRADGMLTMALDLQTRLPGTRAALRAGTITRYKAEVIAWATQLLDPAEARAAESLVLGRAGRLTPGGLRAAIARAVMEVAPEKARKRREAAARDARVQRWAEDSGNAALMGRELPPAEVLAADQRITAWARQLKAAGLEGDMDVLRARAYLDLLLGQDSRPCQDPAGGQDGAGPAGFAGKVTLTVPLATLLDLAERPGEIPGIGPIDPALARDLARAAARNPRTTWCVTVTDQDGHAIGHGCARPQPGNRKQQARRKPGPPDGRDPPRGTSPHPPGPGFSLTASGQHGPPGGYGTWTLHTGTGGPDLMVTLDPIPAGDCDHRFEARGHDPGVKLRHLSQVRHATCTAPICRRPASTCDFEHNTPYEAGGRTCLCNGGPKCRHDHRLKQHPRWQVDQLPDGTFRWTTPSGRTYTTEPTRYPI